MATPGPGLASRGNHRLTCTPRSNPPVLAPAHGRLRRHRVQCNAANDQAKPPVPPAAAAAAEAPPPSSRLTRLLNWRAGADEAAGEAGGQQQQAAIESSSNGQQQQQQQPSSSSNASSNGSGFNLQSWLTRGGGGTSASADGAPDEDAAELGDGMAALPQQQAGASTSSSSSSSGSGTSVWRRSWNTLSSRPFGSATDDEAAQQEVPVQVDHPALQLLRERAMGSSTPGNRSDSFKLGLVVEGGGMRGCVSGGALQALSDLGLRDTFDAVYGSSAGAINGTYFISGQRNGVHIYHEHIATEEFINLKRLWKGQGNAAPVLDLSFLVDHVMHSVLPLDWDAVLTSSLPLKVVASSLDTLDAVVLDRFSDKADLAACLKASANVPQIAGGPQLVRGQRLVDAAVFEAIPFRSAIADGCTHLLVLCTRPSRRRRSLVNDALTDAMEVAIKKAVLSPGYMTAAWKAELDYLMKDGLNQDEMLLRAATDEAAHELPWFAGAHVYPLYPGAAANFSPLCIDAPTLKAGVAEGRRNIETVCRAVLGDVLDFSRFEEMEERSASSNIVSVPSRAAASSTAQLWQRYMGRSDVEEDA